MKQIFPYPKRNFFIPHIRLSSWFSRKPAAFSGDWVMTRLNIQIDCRRFGNIKVIQIIKTTNFLTNHMQNTCLTGCRVFLPGFSELPYLRTSFFFLSFKYNIRIRKIKIPCEHILHAASVEIVYFLPVKIAHLETGGFHRNQAGVDVLSVQIKIGKQAPFQTHAA